MSDEKLSIYATSNDKFSPTNPSFIKELPLQEEMDRKYE